MKDKIKYITTDSLDAMIGDDYIKVAVFNKKKSPYGWTKRQLMYTPYGIDIEEFDFDYVKSVVKEVYSVFPDEEIKELITKVNKYYEKNNKNK